MLKATTVCDRIDENESLAFCNTEATHGGKLVATCSVSDQQCTYLLVTRNYLAIGIFDCRCVRFFEGATNETKDQGGFANCSGSENTQMIVVNLIWHRRFDDKKSTRLSRSHWNEDLRNHVRQVARKAKHAE